MKQPNLFDHNHSIPVPGQEQFPLNLKEQGRNVREVLKRDISNSENYLVITGFTSLSNIIEIFGATSYPKLKTLRIVIGFDPDERVGKKMPFYSLTTEIKNYWLKQNISIRLCAPILNVIENIKSGRYQFRVRDRLHAKIYVGDKHAILGSSNFSKSGILFQTEANIRLNREQNEIEKKLYSDTSQLAGYYYSVAKDYNEELMELLRKMLKDATWEEALARAIAEILESKWMKDYPSLYQALITHQLWPSQKIGIARAMKIMQDQGRVLLADPTGSGKTKFATALAFTVFHWLWENGLRDKSSPLIIAPKQVMDNWDKEHEHFNLYNKIESMGTLSHGSERNKSLLFKQIDKADILIIDEAHNYLHPGSGRSKAISPRGSTHVILSTATPINKKAEDLLRLIELLDIDNLSDEDLRNFLDLRRSRIRQGLNKSNLERLKNYVNQFIVRRTKKDLNKMIDREPDEYKNRLGQACRYPKTMSGVYKTAETEGDIRIAAEISSLCLKIKGIHYLEKLKPPSYLGNDEDKTAYIRQRFNAAKALAGFMVKSALRSSECALYEYLHGTAAANEKYLLKSTKNPTGNIIGKIKKLSVAMPKKDIEDKWVEKEHRWRLDENLYLQACLDEIKIYTQISSLCGQLSGQREKGKALMLLNKVMLHNKILAFDSTVITLDYIKKLLDGQQTGIQSIVATGQKKSGKNKVKEFFSLETNNNDKLIALCSDAMSEGINLQDAESLVLLDMPSVLRIIEQRIGRLERMDSVHKQVHIYWPEESDAFSLKGDRRMIDILVVTDHLIGNNVEIPKTIYDKYLAGSMDVKNYIHAYEEFDSSESGWEGVKDSTQNLYGLIDGNDALIDLKTYHEFKDVDAAVKTAVSFIDSNCNWSFFALRGSTTRSPKWLFIDEKNTSFTDFAEITDKLKIYLGKDKVTQRSWEEINTDQEIKKIVRRLRMHEKLLLPNKKRRALKVAEMLLEQYIKQLKPGDIHKDKCEELLGLFNLEPDASEYVDFDHFADLWLSILIPALDKLKKKSLRQRKIFTLNDLSGKNVHLTSDDIDSLLINCQYASTLDEIISACIIGISPNDKQEI